MSKLNRLIGMASKALGDKGSPAAGNGGANAGGTDWRSIVRSAADAVTGDSRNSTPNGATSNANPTPHPDAAAQAPRGSVGLTPPTAGARRSAPGASATGSAAPGAASLSAADRAAIARYDYLVQTAEPAQLEQIHRDAFARLSPAQRAEVEARLAEALPANERPASSESGHLARAATRAEMMRPGSLRGVLARVRGGQGGRGSGGLAGAGLAGAGVAAAGGVLGVVAGGAIVSAVAAPLLDQAAGLVDFDAIASGIDPENLASGLGEHVSGLGDQASGIGEQVSGFGEQFSNFELPNLGDFFGR